MALQGPALCESFLKVDELTMGKCHMELLPDGTCKRAAKHMTTDEVANMNYTWGLRRGYSDILDKLDRGATAEDILSHVLDKLGIVQV